MGETIESLRQVRKLRAKSKHVHLLEGFVCAPFIDSYSVCTNHGAGSILTVHAMHVDRLVRRVADESQKVPKHVLWRFLKNIHRNVDELHAQIFGSLFFAGSQISLRAQADDCANA